MKRNFCKVLVFGLLLAGIGTHAQAKTTRRFTLILDFSTCVTDPSDANVLLCDEKDGTGKPVGQIKITYENAIGDDGTCGSNPGCAMSWHEGYLYTLEGGTITVGTATAWQEQAKIAAEGGFAPLMGFSAGAVTGGTGRYSGISGTLTMRWNDNLCICLFEVVDP